MQALPPEHIATFKEIRRLFMSKDLATVHEGLLKARALSEHLDYLLGGLTVRDGKLANSIYQRLGRRPYHEFIVFSLLSMAHKNTKASKIRSAIRILPENFFPKALCPALKGFDGLERLCVSSAGRADVVSDDMKLDDGGFTHCSEFPSLTTLKTSIPLTGLKAPKLDHLILDSDHFCKLKNTDIPASVTRLSLRNISSLTDLGFLAENKAIQRIHVFGCSSLRDISALETLCSLTHAVIDAGIETPPRTWPESLLHLEAKGWACSSIGRLPHGLKHFSLTACTEINNLECIQECIDPFTDHALGISATYNDYEFEECTVNGESIAWLKNPPPGYGPRSDAETVTYLHLRCNDRNELESECSNHVSPAGYLSLEGCRNLASLDGLPIGCSLKRILLPSHPIDVSALIPLQGYAVAVSPAAIPFETLLQTDPFLELPRAFCAQSDKFIQSLSCLRELRLIIVRGCIEGEVFRGDQIEQGQVPVPVSLMNLNFLEPLYSELISLDLSEISSVKNITALAGMEKLAEFKTSKYDDEFVAQYSRSSFTTKKQVDSLKLRLLAECG